MTRMTLTGMALSGLENTQKTECEENHKEHDFLSKAQSPQQLQEVAVYFLLQALSCREVGQLGGSPSPKLVSMGSLTTESARS